MANKDRLVFIGAAHVDESVYLQDALQPGESNRAHRSHSIGGVASNAARAASEHINCHLIAVLGEDPAGKSIQQQLQQTNIDCQFVFSGQHPTGQYTAVLDQQGELVIGLASTDVAETLTGTDVQHALEQIQADTATPLVVAFDTNLSSACIAELCSDTFFNSTYLVLAAIGVSPVKTMRLAESGSRIQYLFVNRFEAAMLAGCPPTDPLPALSNALLKRGFRQHVITDGAAAVQVCDAGDKATLEVPEAPAGPRPPGRSRSVNGAGDALAGATLAGLCIEAAHNTGSAVTLQHCVANYGMPAAAQAIQRSINA